MTKKLVVPVLVVGLALFAGCGSDSKSGSTGGSGGSTGGAGGSTGGAGGSTGGAGGSTGGAGGSTGGAGGATGGAGGATGGAGGATGGTDGGAGAPGDGSAGAPGDGGATETGSAANFCADYVPMSGALAGKSANDFCQEYSTVCTFAGANRYTSMGDCMMKYMAGAAGVQTCRAGHLCNAKAAGGGGAHCNHATGVDLCM